MQQESEKNGVTPVCKGHANAAYEKRYGKFWGLVTGRTAAYASGPGFFWYRFTIASAVM